MYNPEKLILNNFGSHKNTEYIFPQNQTSLLCGLNESDEGQVSNGSGKSWIIEGIYYAIIGSALRKIKDSEIIYNDEKFTEIDLTLNNKVLNSSLRIWRKVYSNTKSSELKIYENGEEKKDITSVNEGNKYILEQLGLSRENIVDYFIISKEKYTSFFNSSDTDIKALINRFSKAYIVDPIDDSIKDEVEVHEDKINGLERTLETNKSKIEAYIDSIDENSNDNSELIKNYQNKIDENQNEISELKELNQEQQQKLKEVESELNSSQSIIDEQEPKINELKNTQKEYEDLKDDLNRHLNNEVECPNCNHKFSLKDKEINVHELRDNLPLIDESIKDVLFQQQVINRDLEEAQKSVKLAQSEMQEIEFSINKNTRKITMLNSEINSFRSSIENLQNTDSDKDRVTLDKIEKLEKENSQLENDIRDERKNLTNCNEWLINFKRFKGYLANQSLSAIESYANFYLEQLKSNIRINIQGYKEVKGGKEIREKINVTVLKDGIDAGSFHKLSGGEKARIEIAIIIAMQKLINISTEGRGLNFIVLDEILESLDILGIEILVKSLNELNLNILLISQLVKVEKSEGQYIPSIDYNNIIIVEKRNKISSIV